MWLVYEAGILTLDTCRCLSISLLIVGNLSDVLDALHAWTKCIKCTKFLKCFCTLQDLRQLNLTENKNYSRPSSEKGDSYIDTMAAKYICPVVGLEMNGMYK